MNSLYYYETKVGKIGISDNGLAITNIFWGDCPKKLMAEINESELIKNTHDELCLFFDGKLKQFTFPIEPIGTDFQKKVWNALMAIPYGQTKTYGQVAADVGNPKASRAVGLANNRNPLPFVVPCHRVIGANGSLTGFAGGLDVKEMLLNVEKANLE